MTPDESLELFNKISSQVNCQDDLCCKLSVLTDQIVRLYEAIDLLEERILDVEET